MFAATGYTSVACELLRFDRTVLGCCYRVVVAATQMSCTENSQRNTNRAEKLVRLAKENGAHIILLQVIP